MKRILKKSMVTAVLAAAVLAVVGCSILQTGNERALTVDDVIGMAQADVGSQVIRRQIEVTRSRFELTAADIVRLKKAGVEDGIIESMINTEEMPNYFSWENTYDPYEFGQRFNTHWYPVSYNYPLVYPGVYPYMYPYGVYRRSDLLGRFHRYAPIVAPGPRDYSRSYDPYFDTQPPALGPKLEGEDEGKQ